MHSEHQTGSRGIRRKWVHPVYDEYYACFYCVSWGLTTCLTPLTSPSDRIRASSSACQTPTLISPVSGSLFRFALKLSFASLSTAPWNVPNDIDVERCFFHIPIGDFKSILIHRLNMTPTTGPAARILFRVLLGCWPSQTRSMDNEATHPVAKNETHKT
ncbi:hypothetical protein BC628DRAFT_962793 [Trametes gibbosa]|nr:hypothetical protein BC628DRAFT_962793 [Trametes gibbosa]